jgi:hypothetical protein
MRSILVVAAVVVVVGAVAGIVTVALRNATLRSQVATADARAANAVRVAQARAKSDYATRNAALNREAAALKRKSQVIAAEIGELRANTIRADGYYVVGHDIKRGTWHTTGDGSVTGGHCAYATFGSPRMSDILVHSNFDGVETVHLSGAYAFEISGPCTWVRVPSSRGPKV